MNRAFFSQNRKAIQARLGDAVLVALAAPEATRNNDVLHPYRQDSDFYYLTGVEEPDAALVLTKDDATIFARERDPARETWDGPRLGLEGAKQQLETDHAFSFKELPAKLPELLTGHDRLYYAIASEGAIDGLVLAAVRRARQRVRRGGTAPSELYDSALLLHEQRRIKSEAELALMRKAAAISVEAHLEAMQTARPGLFEYQLQATIEHHFLQAGARRPAYETIVGGGANATTLHYIDNNRPLEDGALVLIDAGCEYQYYAADITRTFPVGGKFTREQQAVYEIVLAAQHAALEKAKTGATQRQLHDAAVSVLAQGLLDLKIIEGDVKAVIEEERYKPYYMHSTGHLLGMDVHDVGRNYTGTEPRPLDNGCVVTVEPGLYFGAHSEAPEPYRGIGIRIEDDIVIRDDGCENLTAALPTSVREVELACAR